MVFYSYTYKVKAPLEAVYNFFLQKEYLIRYFSQEQKQNLRIESKENNRQYVQGERLKVHMDDAKVPAIIHFEIIELKENQFIEVHVEYEYTMDDIDEDEKEDFSDFMSKYVGLSLVYKLEFHRDRDKVLVKEKGFVNPKGFFSRVFWKSIGIYTRFKHRKEHLKVLKELNAL